ncbi:hypothetical protein AGMMS49959_16170 [Planctomycetales bacterium]|nr:hypothetical protein AGMMS49959_16170 [Planctomycetales bacterium]
MVSLEEKAIATYDAEMYYARYEGKAEGMILGMLSRGHSPQAVADFTGIPLARIEQVIIH